MQILKLTKIPPRDSKHQLKDPADLPALRRYQGILRMVRGGRSEEEAIAHYDRPRGICARNGCGKACPGQGRTCAECRLQDQKIAQREYRANNKHHVERTCTKCEAKYVGHRTSDYCPACAPGKNGPRKKRGGAVKAKAIRQDKVALPVTWEKAKPAVVEPPLVVVVPSTVRVRRFDSMGREVSEYPGLRGGL